VPHKAGSPASSAMKMRYSKTRVAVSRGNVLKWLFYQEKATSQTLKKGILTLVLL
jgi:hypothetical protein